MNITTGFGYYVNRQGKKIVKYELPLGEHPDPIDCTFVEVDTKDDLDNIVLDKTDEEIAYEQALADKNSNRTNAMSKLRAIGLTDNEINALIN